MIHALRQFARLLKISAILARYRLDEFLAATHLYRPMRLLAVLTPFGSSRAVRDMPDWTPGKIKDRVVCTRYALPVRFE